MVNNFPLSLLIFNVNFSLSDDNLALVTVITPPTKPQLTEITTVFYINPIHAIFSSKFSTLIAFLGPEFSTQTPKQDCNFGTLQAHIEYNASSAHVPSLSSLQSTLHKETWLTLGYRAHHMTIK